MTIQDSVVIVDGARTAVGTCGGAFKATAAHELAATAIVAALDRAGVARDVVDEVVLGCVGQVGPDAFNARRAALAAGLPAQTNAYNVNRLSVAVCKRSGARRWSWGWERSTSPWLVAMRT